MVRKPRTWFLYSLSLGLLVAACTVSLFAGAGRVPLDQMRTSPIIELRVARTLLGAVAGAALSVSGVVLQTLLRNPLAEPYVLGVSSGAGVGVALAVALKIVALGAWSLPAMAFAGSLATLVLVYRLARQANGAVPIQTLLLSGMVVSAVCGSVLMFIVSIPSAGDLHSILWWLLGNLQIFDGSLLLAVSLVVAAGLLIVIPPARALNVMTLGDEPAAHLGLDVTRTRRLLFIVTSLMTGATVAACGLIGFVGLIVPHTVRLAIGPDHRRLIPISAIGGAAFLVSADSLARTLLAPQEIPIGIITTLVGGPVFLSLLRRRKQSCWSQP